MGSKSTPSSAFPLGPSPRCWKTVKKVTFYFDVCCPKRLLGQPHLRRHNFSKQLQAVASTSHKLADRRRLYSAEDGGVLGFVR